MYTNEPKKYVGSLSVGRNIRVDVVQVGAVHTQTLGGGYL
jgi:hypothetical protein